MTGLTAREWISLPYQLSDPGTFVRYEPYLVADGHGRIHLFWTQDSAQRCCLGSGQFSVLRYAQYSDGIWKDPIDLVRVEGGRVDAASACVDPSGHLHVAFVRNGQAGSIYYMRVEAEDALSSDGWSAPRELMIDQPRTNRIRLRADGAGVLHLVFSRTSGTKGIFYSRSTDGGADWSESTQLDPDIPEEETPQIFQFETDPQGGLHVAWNYYSQSDGEAVGRWLRYARSLDGGMTWSEPFTLDEFELNEDPLTDSVRTPHGIVFTGDQVHVVWTGGPPGGPTGVGRKYRMSPDRGSTWENIETNIFNAWGEQNGDGLASDETGRVHWVGLVRRFVGPGQLWEGLWGADWDGQWSEPSQVVRTLSPGIDSPRLASTADGQLVAAFRSSPDPETGLRYLYATHNTGPVISFPHCGDGGGLSMQIAVNNLSDQTASGRLMVFDQQGKPQPLPFAGLGEESEIELSIAPKATRVLTTLGTSTPFKLGFIRIELDQPEVSGVAIFKYASGPEASVLPAAPGRRFALFVERSEDLNTGIAFARLSPNQPLALSLYGLDGTLLESREYTMFGIQEARFVDELLDVEPGFRGLLVVDSPALLAAVGLRFGAGVLSTIPVIGLDSGDATRGSFLFPHSGDGAGLSMRFVINNLGDEDPVVGKVSFLDSKGQPQELPLAQGSASEFPLDLASHATLLLSSEGSSNPVKTGFVSVEAEPATVGGVAIFKYASGPEASVLPSYPGRKFSLFVTHTTGLDTGVALNRSGSAAVNLALYGEDGSLIASRPFDFPEDGRQGALFLGELFPELGQDFRGLLLLESEEDFAAVGLRFGGGVLSTIPVTGL